MARARLSGSVLSGVLLGVLATGGCPRRFDPRAEERRPVRSEDAERYRKALQALDAGDPRRARELAAPLALPGAAVDADLADSARFVAGVAAYRLGDYQAARAQLQPLSERIRAGDDATELHAILADLFRRDGQPLEALREYERFYRGAGVRPVEQAYARAEARRLIQSLPPEEQGPWRQRFELEAAPPEGSSPAGAVVALGLVAPLSGKDRALGERLLRGALMGLGLLGSPAGSAAAAMNLPMNPIDLRVRDSASSPERAAAAAAELFAEGVVALIGSPVRAEGAAMAAAAEGRGAILVDTSPPAAGSGDGPRGRALRLLRDNPARARALAQHLAQRGLASAAIVAPATPYGKTMSRAAREALAETRTRVLADLAFPEGATTFTAIAGDLLRLRPEALLLFVSAQQLELLAAQLATSGVIPTQNVGGTAAGEPPPVRLVLSTAEGLGERLLRSAGRYLQGAVLAPLSVGALQTDSPALSAAGERYRALLNEEPGALDALGFDAARLLAAACDAGAGRGAPCSGAALRRGLIGLQLDGATGSLRFDPDGTRAGPPLLVRVDGAGLRVVSSGKDQ